MSGQHVKIDWGKLDPDIAVGLVFKFRIVSRYKLVLVLDIQEF